MNSSDSMSDNEVAFAAINLFGNKPTGAEPDWQEIQDWHAGLLDDARAEEVLGHVANNPECFQKWRDICEAAEFLEQSPLADVASDAVVETHQNTQQSADRPAPWDLAGWLSKGMKAITSQPLPAMGGAVAATVLAVLIVPKMLSGPASNPSDMINSSLSQYSALGAPMPQALPFKPKTRSMAGVLGNISSDDIEKHHFNSGMKNAFELINKADSAQAGTAEQAGWTPWLNSLPESDIDCALAADEQHCSNTAADMKALGQWALLNHLACTSTAAIPDDLKQRQNDTLTALTKQDSISSSKLLNPLANSRANESDNGCSLATNLIEIASE